jgi:hypothetical protein
MSDNPAFRALLENWHDGTMSDAELKRFEKLLDDPQRRRELVRDFVDGALLADALKEERAQAPMEEPSRARLLAPQMISWLEHFGARIRLLWRPRLVFACALFSLSIGMLLYGLSLTQRPVVVSMAEARIVRGGRVLERPDDLALRAGDVVQINAEGRVQLQYSDGSTVDLEHAGQARISSNFSKQLQLKAGTARVDAAPQPGWRPMTIETPEARARLVSGRGDFTALPGAAWLTVYDGTAKFSPAPESSNEDTVSAGQFSVVSGSLRQPPLVYDAKSGPPRFVAITVDWKNPSVRGDGNWRIDKEEFSQQKLSAGPDCPVLWSTPHDPTSRVDLDCAATGSILITCEIQVDSLPDEGWYGLALRMGCEGRLAKLHFIGNGPIAGKLQATLSSTAQSGEELGLVECPPFHLGRYHMAMLYARLDDEHVRISGKLWTGSQEPAAWMVQGEAPLADAVRRFGLETTHCACTFRGFKAMLVR